MIDTHAHLTSRFGGEMEIGNLRAVILAASSIEDSKENIELGKKYPDKLFPSIGIHPQVREIGGEKLEQLIEGVVAVGECGLDFSDDYDLGEQTEKFERQIKLAIKYNLPLIIHAREAVDEVIEILKKYPGTKGVFHCYTGGKKRIKKILDLGEWYFGIDGNVTYEVGLEMVVKNIPKDKLLAETDCPELTPVPFRGEKNKPIYVEYVYKKIAEIWGLGFEETEKIIDDNTQKLFSLIRK
ncbi:hypothetical protein A3K55_01125 [Candidatus Shapirobacteria bacterium RBG_13_44_7]|uniref:Hydrolase TatD n=1 Tax=Candidatus Shapirobacteria bacterium RBG_13_44_7 TaxID=1802149 RepID=A0A1F7SIL8_9BACT|nr:MAG: hypothetical protein A3K55_01125 [Candidatus Shapirobacteria bacterium RBG_13_44_7]